MDIKTVGVVGAGTMGSGIAQVFAQAGLAVRLVDVAQPMLDRARRTIEKGLGRLVEKETLAAPARDATLGRIVTTTTLDALADADYIIEAIVEQAEAKRALFAKLDALARPAALLASNTSSISITILGAATTRPDRVLGMHFMNPVPVMTLVELVRGQATSEESMQIAAELCRVLGKTSVETADYPGFIANRILMPMINEAIYAVMEGRRDAGRHRYRHEAGNEPPDGPAGARRFHRPRCVPRDPGRAARGFRGSEIQTVPASPPQGRRRGARTQVGPRLSRVRLITLTAGHAESPVVLQL